MIYVIFYILKQYKFYYLQSNFKTSRLGQNLEELNICAPDLNNIKWKILLEIK